MKEFEELFYDDMMKPENVATYHLNEMEHNDNHVKWAKQAVEEMKKEILEKDFYIAQLEDALETTRKLLSNNNSVRISQDAINQNIKCDKEINMKL